jgi:hypothetical protein
MIGSVSEMGKAVYVNKVTEGLLPLPSALLWPSARESPASEEARRASILSGQSPLRRDQISVKLSSPSPFTSEA